MAEGQQIGKNKYWVAKIRVKMIETEKQDSSSMYVSIMYDMITSPEGAVISRQQ